jgi:hypothetical protein
MFSHAVSREIALPRTDAERYRKVARAAIGLTSSDVRRFRAEHAWLRANDASTPVQYARDVIDVDERVMLMNRIAARYAALHARQPELFAWAAFAAIAVNDGVRPTAELAMSAGAIARAVDVGDVVARVAEDGAKCAFEVNFAIYMDLAWVHEAYLDGGIEVVRWLCEDNVISKQVREGFEDMERGRLLGGVEGRHLIAQGNLVLLEHEQRVIVTPIFAKYAAALAWCTDLGLIHVPNFELAAECAAQGRDPRWNVSLCGESYGPFVPRWGWLLEHGWRPFVARFWRGGFAASLARAANGRPENRAPAARAALRLVQRMLTRD